MTKLLLITLCVLGLAGCSTSSQPSAARSYQTEQAALESATAVGSSAAFDAFLLNYPKSPWAATAVYRRDRAALEEAKRIGTREAFEDFLKRHPRSDWADQARYFLEYGVTKKRE